MWGKKRPVWNQADQAHLETTPSQICFSDCLSSQACMTLVPRLISSLFIVQICAANAACTFAACANIVDTELSNVFIDCVTLCNANKTIMYPYANKTCVEVRKAQGTLRHHMAFVVNVKICSEEW
jgi:hypothetical protein